MFSMLANVCILVVVLATAIGFVRLLNRLWPLEMRAATNQQVGWQLSVLGTTYAVTLGFMLYTEWAGFASATLNVELEASALRNVFRLAEGLPQPQRDLLQSQTREYAKAVIENDWPELARREIPESSHRVNEAMWGTLMSVHATTGPEATAEDHALSELASLTEHRRTRLLQSITDLPLILWAVLLVGALLTIISVSIFGAPNSVLHEIQVASITLLISLVMLAIADIGEPFRGWVHIDSLPFARAQANMPLTH
jgi:ABC-type multidrug transport system fused ATPase/permease subunit